MTTFSPHVGQFETRSYAASTPSTLVFLSFWFPTQASFVSILWTPYFTCELRKKITFFNNPALPARSFPHHSFFLTDTIAPYKFYYGIYQCFVICLPRTAQLWWSICFSARSCFCYPIFQLDWQRHKEVKWPAWVRQCQWLGTDWSPWSPVSVPCSLLQVVLH